MIQMKDGKKVYNTNGIRTEAIRNMTFEIPDGEFVAIMGPSGSGKSTLLNILGGMDALTEGELFIDGQNMAAMKQGEADAFRKERLCFIFQSFALMDAYTVSENVELPLLAQNMKKSERKRIVEEKLAMLGISELAGKQANAISGGQQQRTAIARALATEADIILADEPTGALDSKNSRVLMNILQEIHEKSQPRKTILMVTHDQSMAEYADRILHIQDGEIVEDGYIRDKKEIEETIQRDSQENIEKTIESAIQEENTEPANEEAGKRKRIPKWVKGSVFFAFIIIMAVVYCFHKTESKYYDQPSKHIEGIDSVETDVTLTAGEGVGSSPCDVLHAHITGEVVTGEITLLVYEELESEYERTSDNVLVWKPKEGYHPVFSRTYHAGESIDQWFEFQREKGSVYCSYEYVVLSPTNTDLDATITNGAYTTYYGWQDFITSIWGKWLGERLGIETERGQ